MRRHSSDVARALRTKLEELGEVLDEALQGAGEAAGGVGERMRQGSRTFFKKGRQRAIELERDVEDLVREKPVASILVAAGIAACAGLLAGMLWKRE